METFVCIILVIASICLGLSLNSNILYHLAIILVIVICIHVMYHNICILHMLLETIILFGIFEILASIIKAYRYKNDIKDALELYDINSAYCTRKIMKNYTIARNIYRMISPYI